MTTILLLIPILPACLVIMPGQLRLVKYQAVVSTFSRMMIIVVQIFVAAQAVDNNILPPSFLCFEFYLCFFSLFYQLPELTRLQILIMTRLLEIYNF